jgi:hypothetical protein
MGELIVSFEAMDTGNDLLWWSALVIAILGFTGTFLILFFRLIKDYNYRLLFAMLLFFVAMIAAGTAFYTHLTASKLGPVRFFTEGLSTPYGSVRYDDIKDAYIETDQERALINPNQINRRTRILIIEERQDKLHLLSEINYPVEEIFRVLKQQVRREG